MAALHRIFVYGTLKRGHPNHHLLGDRSKGESKFVGEARLTEKFPLVVAGRCNIPFLLSAKGQGKEVYGEVYEVDAAMLVHIDELENYPIFYTRTLTKCSLVNPSGDKEAGHVLDCVAYFLENFKRELLQLPSFSTYTGQPPEQKSYVARTHMDVMSIINEVKNLPHPTTCA